MRRLTTLAALLCATGALAACGGDDEEAPADGGGSASLSLTAQEPGADEFAWDPSSLDAAAGSVTIAMDNPSADKAPHSVAIEGNGVSESSDVVQPGDSTEVTADLEPGTYQFFCTVGDHREDGMEGTLTVE